MIPDDTTLAVVAVAASMVLVVIAVAMAMEFSRRQRNFPAAAALEGIETRLEKRHGELADVENVLAQKRGEMTRQQAAENEVVRLEERIAELRAQHAGMDEQRREIERMVREGEAAAIELADRMRDLSEVESKAATAQAEARRAEERARSAAELEAQLPDIRTRVDAAWSDLATLEAEADGLRALKAEAERLIHAKDERRREIERLEALEQRLQADVASLGARRVEALGGEVAQLAAERAALGRDLDGVRAALEATRREEREARAVIAASKAQIGAPGAPQDRLEDLRVPLSDLAALRRPSDERMDEERALDRLREHVAAAGLRYPDRTLKAFHTALKVNETSQLAVLAGISGTGKSQLPRVYAQALGMGFLLVPVQPRWDSPQDLMGFYNYVEGRYRATDLARALWAMDGQGGDETLGDRMLVVLLDEMNLARVEYYFADFLSRLENRPPPGETGPDRRTRAEIVLDVPTDTGGAAPRIYPGHNVLFAGTMNEDESTQSLSDKVLDRANLLRFAPPARFEEARPTRTMEAERPLSFERWLAWRRDVPLEGWHRAEEVMGTMTDVMAKLGRPFGYRLRRAMLAYVASYPGEVLTALSDQVEMRLLPKARGIDVDDGGRAGLDAMVALARDRLEDEPLAEAIEQSIERSRESGGRFAWQGIVRG